MNLKIQTASSSSTTVSAELNMTALPGILAKIALFSSWTPVFLEARIVTSTEPIRFPIISMYGEKKSLYQLFS